MCEPSAFPGLLASGRPSLQLSRTHRFRRLPTFRAMPLHKLCGACLLSSWWSTCASHSRCCKGRRAAHLPSCVHCPRPGNVQHGWCGRGGSAFWRWQRLLRGEPCAGTSVGQDETCQRATTASLVAAACKSFLSDFGLRHFGSRLKPKCDSNLILPRGLVVVGSRCDWGNPSDQSLGTNYVI